VGQSDGAARPGPAPLPPLRAAVRRGHRAGPGGAGRRDRRCRHPVLPHRLGRGAPGPRLRAGPGAPVTPDPRRPVTPGPRPSGTSDRRRPVNPDPRRPGTPSAQPPAEASTTPAAIDLAVARGPAVGGKAGPLAELLRTGFDVPPG